jgi:hypothetical protein
MTANKALSEAPLGTQPIFNSAKRISRDRAIGSLVTTAGTPNEAASRTKRNPPCVCPGKLKSLNTNSGCLVSKASNAARDVARFNRYGRREFVRDACGHEPPSRGIFIGHKDSHGRFFRLTT